MGLWKISLRGQSSLFTKVAIRSSYVVIYPLIYHTLLMLLQIPIFVHTSYVIFLSITEQFQRLKDTTFVSENYLFNVDVLVVHTRRVLLSS